MQSTILELSHYSSDDKDSNSEWTNRIARPITLEDGDAVLLKNVYVDSRLIGSDSILIEQDVEWDIYFMYWIQGHGVNQNIVQDPTTPNVITPFTPDGLPYYFMDVRQLDPNIDLLSYRPVTDFFRIKIPNGIYQRPALADIISRQCSGLGNGNGPPMNQSPIQVRFSNGLLVPIYKDGVFQNFDICGNATTEVVTPFQKPLYFGINTSNPGGELSYCMFYIDNFGGYQPAFFNYMTDNPNYNTQLTNMITVATSLDVASQRLTTIQYAGQDYDIFSGSTIGAQNMAFVYDDNNGDGRFSWQYCHSPLINSNNQVVGTYQKKQTDYNWINDNLTYLNAYSGIMFVGMKTNLSDDPKNDPFFTQLGMKYSDMVPDEIPNFWAIGNKPTYQNPFTPFSYNNTFYKYTTRNFLPLGTQITPDTVSLGSGSNTYNISRYLNIYDRSALMNASTYVFTDSNTSMNINASSAPISSTTNAGHYLIEINNIHLSDYWNNEKSYNIKGMVSNFFLSSDNFILSGSPDSLVYIHSGAPLTLTSMKISILNPVTKRPAENLGPNSSIYLQITKERKQLQPPEETKK